MVHTIIGLCGLAGCGKDTAADHIARHLRKYHEKLVRVISLGDILKEITHDTCRLLRPEAELDRSILWGGTHIKNTHKIRDGVTVRKVLQYFGTDILRKHLGDDVFVNALCERISKIGSQYDMIIVPDIRFVNEIRGLVKYTKEHKHQMWMVHVIRDGIEQMKHSSEGNAQLIMDIFEDTNPYGPYRMETLWNNGTKAQFYERVEEFTNRMASLS